MRLPFFRASFNLYIEGSLSGNVDVRAGDTICRSLKPPVTTCDAIYAVYTVKCVKTVRARSVQIIQKTETPSQLKVCEIGVGIIGTA